MQLYEEKKYNTSEEIEKSKKLMKIIIIMIVILVIFAGATIGMIYYIKSTEFKLVINGVRTKASSELFLFENDKVYVSIKDIAPLVGYTSYNGGYKEYNEDSTKCYLESENEVAYYEKDSNTMYKIIIDNNDKNSSIQTENDYEYYTLGEAVVEKNGKLYTTMDGISLGCNLIMNYNQEKNEIDIYTLPYIATSYSKQITNSSLNDKDAIFSNKKALRYNMIVVKNTNNKYGVYDLSGNVIIGEKYASLVFLESTEEFIVKTDEGKMGIISSDGTTKIQPEYASIKQIDKNSGLYLVSSTENKYGIINNSGRTVLHLQYDKIGIEANSFPKDNIKNPYLLYDYSIPVKRDNKWYLYDKYGQQIITSGFENCDSFGCTKGTAVSSISNNVLLIPEYNGIVVCEGGLYGLIDYRGNRMFEAGTSNIYSIVNNDVIEYYMIYRGATMDTLEYLRLHAGELPSQENNNSNIMEETEGQTYVQEQNNNTENQNVLDNMQESQTNSQDNRTSKYNAKSRRTG